MLKLTRWALILSALILTACGRSTAGSSITPTSAGDEVVLLVTPETNPRLTLMPESAIPGQQVKVTGDGWPPNASVALTLRPGSTVIAIPLDLGAAAVNAQGLFSFAFRVPPDAAPGEWTVRASAHSRLIESAIAPFIVLPPPDKTATVPAATVPATASTPQVPASTPVLPTATAPPAPTEMPAPPTPDPSTPAPATPAQPATPQRVRFPVGATSITLTPLLNPGVPITYVLGILGGQTLTIQVTPAAHISILDIQGHVLNAAEQTLSFALPYTGDYIIVIDSATVADPATVQISIPPPPQTPPP